MTPPSKNIVFSNVYQGNTAGTLAEQTTLSTKSSPVVFSSHLTRVAVFISVAPIANHLAAGYFKLTLRNSVSGASSKRPDSHNNPAAKPPFFHNL